MNKSNFSSIRQSSSCHFRTSLLISLLVAGSSFSLQASQTTKPGMLTLAGSGLAMYLSAKVSVLKAPDHLDEMLPKHQSTNMLQLVPRSEGSDYTQDDRQGKKLVKLYIYNNQLSSTIIEELTANLIPNQQVCFERNLPDLSCNTSGREASQSRETGLGKFFSRGGSLKKVAGLCLLASSITGASAGQTDGVELVDQGAALCAACIAGCCLGLGVPEGPVCVVHCATTVCAWLCAFPLG